MFKGEVRMMYFGGFVMFCYVFEGFVVVVVWRGWCVFEEVDFVVIMVIWFMVVMFCCKDVVLSVGMDVEGFVC